MNEKLFNTNSRVGIVEMVVRHMRAGLIPSSRLCPLCRGPMRLGFFKQAYKGKYKAYHDMHDGALSYQQDHNTNERPQLRWLCVICYNSLTLGNSTILNKSDLSSFDGALQFYCNVPAAKQTLISKLFNPLLNMHKEVRIGRISSIDKFYVLFQRALQHYWVKNVKSYIKLPGPVEMDETKAGQERGCQWGLYGKHPVYKWIYGLYCRRTQIPVMYYVKNRRSHNIYPKIKAHAEPGTIMMSDEFSVYMCTVSMRSRLADMGFFHYFINHNAGEYFHNKFPFVHTMNIESQWRNLKVKTAIKSAKTRPQINTVVDSYCARQLISNEKLYDFVLRQINRYYFDKLQEWKVLCSQEESMTEMDEICYPIAMDIQAGIDAKRSLAKIQRSSIKKAAVGQFTELERIGGVMMVYNYDIDDLYQAYRGDFRLDPGLQRILDSHRQKEMHDRSVWHFTPQLVSLDPPKSVKDVQMQLAESRFSRNELDISTVRTGQDLAFVRKVKDKYRENMINPPDDENDQFYDNNAEFYGQIFDLQQVERERTDRKRGYAEADDMFAPKKQVKAKEQRPRGRPKGSYKQKLDLQNVLDDESLICKPTNKLREEFTVDSDCSSGHDVDFQTKDINKDKKNKKKKKKRVGLDLLQKSLREMNEDDEDVGSEEEADIKLKKNIIRQNLEIQISSDDSDVEEMALGKRKKRKQTGLTIDLTTAPSMNSNVRKKLRRNERVKKRREGQKRALEEHLMIKGTSGGGGMVDLVGSDEDDEIVPLQEDGVQKGPIIDGATTTNLRHLRTDDIMFTE